MRSGENFKPIYRFGVICSSLQGTTEKNNQNVSSNLLIYFKNTFFCNTSYHAFISVRTKYVCLS
jgi:hypothetical protein